MSTPAILRHRRDTAANWTSNDTVLEDGQIGVETDTIKIKVGDGVTAWTSLGYLSAAASLADGDYGDIVISSSGAAINIDSGVLTAAGRAIIDDADASAQRTTLGLGSLATQSGTFSGTSSGTNTGDQTITLTGDVTGSGTGSFAATIASDAVTYAKIQNVSATDKVLGRSTAGSGDVEEIACTAAGRAIIDDATAADQRTTLGLGTVATLESDTDGTLAANSDSRIATQKAVKTYADAVGTASVITAPASSIRNTITPVGDRTALSLQASLGQTSNLFEALDDTSTPRFHIDAGGTAQSSVNPAGSDDLVREGYLGTAAVADTGDFDASGTAASAITAHEGDTTAHPASSIVNTPAGNIAATDVQAALNELDTEKSSTSHTHAASAITFTPVGTIAATDTQTAVAEVATDAASALTTHAGAADPHTGYLIKAPGTSARNTITPTGDFTLMRLGADPAQTANLVEVRDSLAALNFWLDSSGRAKSILTPSADDDLTRKKYVADNFQPLDATLTALAGVTTSANKVIYATGSDTFAATDLTTAARGLLDDTSTTDMRTTLGLVIGTNVQAYDAELAAIAGLTSAADKVPYFTGSGTAAVATFTTTGRNIVGSASQQAACAAMGAPWTAGFTCVPVSNTATTAEELLWYVLIPGGSMGANGRIEIDAEWSNNNSGNNKTFRIRVHTASSLGGTQIWSNINTTSIDMRTFGRWVGNAGATNSQRYRGATGDSGGSAVVPTTLAFDTTSAIYVQITGQKANSGDTLSFESGIVRVFYQA